MQVRLYKQRESQVVPECFKTAIKVLEQVTQRDSFARFKQIASRVTSTELGESAQVYSLSRIVKGTAGEQISQVEYRSLLRLSADMPF